MSGVRRRSSIALSTSPSLKANVVHHTSQNLSALLTHNHMVHLFLMYALLIMLHHAYLMHALGRVLECYCVVAFLAGDCQVEGGAMVGEGVFACWSDGIMRDLREPQIARGNGAK